MQDGGHPRPCSTACFRLEGSELEERNSSRGAIAPRNAGRVSVAAGDGGGRAPEAAGRSSPIDVRLLPQATCLDGGGDVLARADNEGPATPGPLAVQPATGLESTLRQEPAAPPRVGADTDHGEAGGRNDNGAGTAERGGGQGGAVLCTVLSTPGPLTRCCSTPRPTAPSPVFRRNTFRYVKSLSL